MTLPRPLPLWTTAAFALPAAAPAAVAARRGILRPEYEIEGLQVGEVIANILEQVTVPR